MDEYIKKETVVTMLRDRNKLFNLDELEFMAKNIIKLPAEDVVPMRYGHFEYDPETAMWGFPYICSSCRKAHNCTELYCPNCGAKMGE